MNNTDDYSDRSDKGFKRIIFAVMLFAAALIIACLATGCSPVKRMGALAAKHPQDALTVCDRMFPPHRDTVTRFDYVEGRTVTNYDTVTIDCDSVIEQSRVPGSTVQTRLVRVPCPPSTIRVDSFIKTITITQTDTKAEKLLVIEKDKSADYESKFKTWRKRAWWSWGALGLIGVIGVAGFVLKMKRIV